MSAIQAKQRTAYFSPTAHRYFFSKIAAASREASAQLGRKYPSEPPYTERGVVMGDPWHWRDDERLVKIHARLTRRLMRQLKDRP